MTFYAFGTHKFYILLCFFCIYVKKNVKRKQTIFREDTLIYSFNTQNFDDNHAIT